MEAGDFYQVLGIDRSASLDEIKRAYREIARVYHPDSNFFSEIVDEKPSAEVVDRFKLITDAYNTLSSEEKRKLYDLSLGIGLKGWEEETKNSHDAKVSEVAAKDDDGTRVEAYGRFGSNVAPESAVLDEETADKMRPLSEMISLKRGMLHRLLKMTGLK